MYYLRHPIELFAFPLRLYSTFGSKMLVEFLHGKSREQETLASLGHAPYLDPFGPLQNLCRIPSAYLKHYGFDTLQHLVHTYKIPGTDVMVYLAPIPNCTNSGDLAGRPFSTLAAAPPRLLPPTAFAAAASYAHIRPGAVPQSSNVFAAALKQQLQQIAPAH